MLFAPVFVMPLVLFRRVSTCISVPILHWVRAMRNCFAKRWTMAARESSLPQVIPHN